MAQSDIKFQSRNFNLEISIQFQAIVLIGVLIGVEIATWNVEKSSFLTLVVEFPRLIVIFPLRPHKNKKMPKSVVSLVRVGV
ncbi:hypothetical protein [Spirulina sp. 06S082]|uniref:hypothetical protein n=1 Tax=Spirulina sp. 06S082 TaxID=3110248 RepID=UPI002B1EC937|nr:hypothetical protein [Spirulina sp. 06S082]MEA5472267.1 hypothetical protein [Spirulina sp. 06S082]